MFTVSPTPLLDTILLSSVMWEVSCLMDQLPGRRSWEMHMTKRKLKEARGKMKGYNKELRKRLEGEGQVEL